MEKLPMCRVCLADNVRMYKVVNRNLHKLYEKLTNIPFVTDDSRPILACFICCAKLKQGYRLLQQCLEVEELFTQRMNEDDEPNPVVNQDRLQFSGFIKSPIDHIHIDDECQSITIKEELPAVCEGVDSVVEPKRENQSDELELEHLYNSHLDVRPSHHSHLEDDEPLIQIKTEVEDEEPLIEIKTEVEDEEPLIEIKTEVEYEVPLIELKTEVEDEEVPKKKRRARETKKLELEHLYNSRLDVRPIHHSHLEDDEPLIQIKTEVEDEEPLIEIKTEVEDEEPLIEIKTEVEDEEPLIEIKTEVEDEEPLIEIKTEVEDEEVPKKKRRARETIKLELEHLDSSCLDVADIPPHHSASALKDDEPVIELQTEVKDKEVSKKKRRAKDVEKATVARRPKLDTRRIKEEDAIPVEQTIKDKSDSKVIRTAQKHTSKPDTYFKEPYKCSQPGEKPYKCDVCHCSFLLKASLTKHIRKHTGERPYKCDVCGWSFSDNSTLTRHIRVHTGEKPFMCGVCQRSFRDKNHLMVHFRIHTGERPYKCDVCECSFREKSKLTKHIRIHTGEKPYQCDVCQHSFSDKSTLTRHTRIHTVEKPFMCRACKCSFTEKGHLTKHIRIHTGENP